MYDSCHNTDDIMPHITPAKIPCPHFFLQPILVVSYSADFVIQVIQMESKFTERKSSFNYMSVMYRGCLSQTIRSGRYETNSNYNTFLEKGKEQKKKRKKLNHDQKKRTKRSIIKTKCFGCNFIISNLKVKQFQLDFRIIEVYKHQLREQLFLLLYSNMLVLVLSFTE